MGGLSVDLIGTLNTLLPGLIAAFLFYTLTPYRPPAASVVERVVGALLLLAVIRLVVLILRWSLERIGTTWFTIGEWNADVELLNSFGVAVFVGVGLSWMTNYGSFHKWLRAQRITKRTSFPSEWYSAFHQYEGLRIILHLKGDRRLYGYPKEFPDDPTAGHFLITEPAWICSSINEFVPSLTVEAMLIPVGDVEYVEFEKTADSVKESVEEIVSLQRPLVDLHQPPQDASAEPSRLLVPD